MRTHHFFLAAVTAAALSGCSTLQQVSSSVGCWVDRTVSTPDPRCAARSTASPGAITTAPPLPAEAGNPAPPERWSPLQKALDQEIEQARTAQAQAVAATQSLPATQRARAGSLQLHEVPVTDRQTGQVRKLRALESVSVELPLAGKGSAPYKQAMDTLKGLANQLADNRGAAQIVVHQSEDDTKARRVNTATGVTHSHSGKPVAVQKRVDRALPQGVERYTIEAGEIRGQL